MAADSGFFRLGSITEARGGLVAALSHNKRTLPKADHIDGTRSHLNTTLFSVEATPEKIDKWVQKRFIDLDIKPRSNAVLGVELIFSLPLAWHDCNTKPFFQACLDWLPSQFKGDLLSFDIHLDEKAPHAHAIILPILDGKLQGDKIKGNRGDIKKRMAAFAEQVGVPFGLPMSTKLYYTDREKLARLVIKHIDQNAPQTRQASYWQFLRDSIYKNPQPLAELYGVHIKPVPLSKHDRQNIKTPI